MNPRPRRRRGVPASTWSRRPATGYAARRRPGGIARRRLLVRSAKLLLPVGALALLAMIALWPEFDRAADQSRVALPAHGPGASAARR